jgi:hypothetical protein
MKNKALISVLLGIVISAPAAYKASLDAPEPKPAAPAAPIAADAGV